MKKKKENTLSTKKKSRKPRSRPSFKVLLFWKMDIKSRPSFSENVTRFPENVTWCPEMVIQFPKNVPWFPKNYDKFCNKKLLGILFGVPVFKKFSSVSLKCYLVSCDNMWLGFPKMWPGFPKRGHGLQKNEKIFLKTGSHFWKTGSHIQETWSPQKFNLTVPLKTVCNIRAKKLSPLFF